MVKSHHPLGRISTRIELPPEVRVPLVRPGSAEPARDVAWSIADSAAAAQRALETPLNFPSLKESVVPGDKLAIALDEAVPDAVNVVRGAIAAAQAAGIEAASISVVCSDEDFCKLLRDELGEGIQVVIHDPDDEQQLALVCLNEKNERLLVNRSIFEADVVLPIGCARLATASGCSVFECLFPRLSDSETISRLRTPSQRSTPGRIARSKHRSDEAGWLIGAILVMQVVPGIDGGVAEIVAGTPETVAERCQQACEALWSYEVPQQASLVIANVTGGPLEQTWENIGRSLAAIETLVEDGGAIAICSDLADDPGHALGQLIDSDDYFAVENNVRNDHSPDSWPAWHLARALQRGPVYFLSRLEDETVEELGLAPIADVEELNRLASHQSSCIVLEDSQHAVATLAGSEDDDEDEE